MVCGAEALRIGLACCTCWVCNSCVEADEKENQLKQKLEAAQAAGWDSFMAPRLSYNLNILEPSWTILLRYQSTEKCACCMICQQECIFWSRSSHLNTVLPPSLERFVSAFFNQFACQEEAKASAQSLQETLAAKKEAGNTKEWGVSSDLSSRVVVDGWYDIGPIPSREKGIDSRRLEWESLSTRSSPHKFFLQVEEEKERAEAAAAEAEETCSTVVSWTVFHNETIFCDSAQLKQFCHSSLPRNCEKGPKSLNTLTLIFRKSWKLPKMRQVVLGARYHFATRFLMKGLMHRHSCTWLW